MALPGFNADASLYTPTQRYRSADIFDRATGVVPQLTHLFPCPAAWIPCAHLSGTAFERCVCRFCGGHWTGSYCYY
jgi:hypothetical protein